MHLTDERERRAAALAEDARVRFEALYERLPTWEIGRPQPAFVELHERGDITGAVLDVGCGTGDNALYFAERGHPVWGIDVVAPAVAMARAKASRRGLPAARFLAGDALRLDRLSLRFDTVTDCGLFHALSDEERALYLPSVAAVLRPGGHLHLLCYSDAEPGEDGPRRITRAELEHTFAPWRLARVVTSRIERTIARGSAAAWLATIHRPAAPAPTRRAGG